MILVHSESFEDSEWGHSLYDVHLRIGSWRPVRRWLWVALHFRLPKSWCWTGDMSNILRILGSWEEFSKSYFKNKLSCAVVQLGVSRKLSCICSRPQLGPELPKARGAGQVVKVTTPLFKEFSWIFDADLLYLNLICRIFVFSSLAYLCSVNMTIRKLMTGNVWSVFEISACAKSF